MVNEPQRRVRAEIVMPALAGWNARPLHRHARLYAGHPRLWSCKAAETWMAGTSPAMTN